jgi:prepilin-type N-terminal cleavage/methylation domain-containing protein
MSCRRGFTLVEITLALGLMLIVIGGVYQLFNTSQRVAQAQAAQLTVQSNVRTAALVVANELRGLSSASGGLPAQNDLVSLGPSSVTYRAARGVGFLCEPLGSNGLRIGRAGFSGLRDPEPARDMAYLFLENNPESPADDAWLQLGITGVSSATCPGGVPAINLTTSAGAGEFEVPAGTPVRIYETMELKGYQSEGAWWLGARSVSAGEVIQPLAGPLSGPDGFQLEFLNSRGAPTHDPAAASAIRITVRSAPATRRLTGTGPGPREELVTQVALRNAIRP